MSRFTQYDEVSGTELRLRCPTLTVWSKDEYRLPEGMRRVGYDADTQRYTFQDSDGSYWEGPAGARYGELRPGPHPTMTPTSFSTTLQDPHTSY